MADYDRRGGGGGYGNNRKRRARDEDEFDRRGPRRRYDYHQPSGRIHNRVRTQLLALAESPLRRGHEEVQSLARMVFDNYADSKDLRNTFPELCAQVAIEQPLKTPFVAAVLIIINASKPEIMADVLVHIARKVAAQIEAGEWRDVKCSLKLLACLQPCLKDDGIFPLLDELFNKAGELQTTSSDDTIGTELVKIILLTIPYIMASVHGKFEQQAVDLMEKTDIIASEPHTLQALLNPYPSEGDEPGVAVSFLGLLQKQLLTESSNGWPLACLPKPWIMPEEEAEQQEKIDNAAQHALPPITVPDTVIRGPRPPYPEVYFSVYADEEVESVPPMSNIASSLIRDGLLDTVNILDFNRNVTARYLIDIDCYFAEGTFARRATPFDRLKDLEPGRSTWKPEDVAVDTVFSQIFQLPKPEHKLVYYHSVLTEACKIAPAAIAPSLGRAIRYLYRNTPKMDLELSHRFVDWFSHHLSNFGFTWKWTEWVEDLETFPVLHPCRSFIVGSLDKEIRLSFAQRIKGTLPVEYHPLIGKGKEQDSPEFKFRERKNAEEGDEEGGDEKSKATKLFASEGRELAQLLKRKATDEDIEPVIERIHTKALEAGLNPLVSSTDCFVTAVCFVGSKSLSHVLACIERTKERLLNIGAASELARAQIITSVAEFWRNHPGVAKTIVEKLLNYCVLFPRSVVEWCLSPEKSAMMRGSGFQGPGLEETVGGGLAGSHVFEMVLGTVEKVTGRVREVVRGPEGVQGTVADGAGVDGDVAREKELKSMRDLFTSMEAMLSQWAENGINAAGATPGSNFEPAEGNGDGDEQLVMGWGRRWRKVFERRAAIEEAWLGEVEGDRERVRVKREREAERVVVEMEDGGMDVGV